jgi:hypothetical protein
MSGKAYKYLIIVGGAVCAFVFIRVLFFVHVRPVRSDVIQGAVIGFGIALATARITAQLKTSKSNAWTTIYKLNQPGNGMLMRAACALAFPGPVNVPQEAMYWTASVDGAGRELSGKRCYVMHFPAGKLPPNNAFWSLTMGDANNRFVENAINRYSVGDRSGLVPNDDGSVDIRIQNIAPEGRESNWLPAPTGNFILWLRVYMPDKLILDGKYEVPPIEEAN